MPRNKFDHMFLFFVFIWKKGINSLPTKRPRLTKLTIVVSANDDIPFGTLVKPLRLPHIKSTPGKTTKFRVPLEVTVNSHLIRRLNTHDTKYRLCSKKSKFSEWHPNSKHSPPCTLITNILVPIALEIPINIESIVEDVGPRSDITESIKVRTFDGPEKTFARLQDDYYSSQVAVGDPIRARRTKRTQLDDKIPDSFVDKVMQALWRRRDQKYS